MTTQRCEELAEIVKRLFPQPQVAGLTPDDVDYIRTLISVDVSKRKIKEEK